MSIQSFKLKLIRKIMATDDAEVLETIQEILNRVETKTSNVSLETPPPDLIAQALGLSPASNLDEDTDDLQQSIDEIFSPKG